MAKQGINTGTSPNDGLGDSLLVGAIKINENFSEIYNTFGDGTNLIGIQGISTYSNFSGVATYATNAGIATYATNAGIATYATNAGIATYAPNAGIATYATSSGISTDATKLQNARTFEITGDIVASPISFDGTGNVSLAATIQPNSVALGSDTTGDYVQSITGTANQISVSVTSGESSTPVISIPSNPVLPGNVTIANDLQVNNNLNVTGNITIGGTSAYIVANEFRVKDADIVLGFTTSISGQDVSNDTTASHGGIAVASTEGNPLVNLNVAGIETLPPTYKKIMWFKTGEFAGLGTDAWLFNYGVGIGSTQVPNGVRLAVGGVHVTDNTVTATTFSGNASFATYATLSGISTYADNAGIATYAPNAGIATYATNAGIATYATLSGISTYAGIATYATLSGISTYADNAGIATYAPNAGIATYATNAGIATIAEGLTGTPNLNVGVITATSFNGSGINLTGVITSLVSGTNVIITQSSGIATISASGDYATIAGYSTSSGISTVAQGLTGTPSINVYNVGVASAINVGAASTFQKSVHFESTLLIGDTDELQIFHDGNNSYIDNASAGNLIIRDSGTGIQLKKTSGALMGVFNNDAGVELYYDGVLKFQTFQNGVAINESVGIGSTAGNPPYRLTVSGVGATITQGLANAIADFTSSVNGYGQVNVRNSLSGTNASGDIVVTANTGTDTSNFIDLGINNTGFTTSSWTINGALDGYLYTSDGNLSIGAASASKYLSLFAGGTLAANEQVRVTTTGVGIGTTNSRFALEVGAVGASGTSLQVNGDVRITGITTYQNSISIRPLVGGNEYLSISPNGRMVLGSAIGTDAGIEIINNTTSPTAEIFTITTPNVGLYDKKIIVDYGGRLLLGGNLDSSLNNAFTVIDNSGNIKLTGYVSAGGTIGASALYVGSGTTITSDGTIITNQLNVSGVSTFTGSVSFGTSTYFADNVFVYFGNSSDLYIGHNGTISAIADSGTGDLYIAGDNSLVITDLSYAENKAKFNTNGSVELYYDNSKKFETLGTGVTVTGTTFTNQLSVSGVVTATTFIGNLTGTATTTTNIPNLTGDITSNGTATSIASGVIVNDDINASAAIAVSKLSASTISGVTLGNNLSTLTLNTSGTGLSGSTTYNGSGSATFTVASNATSSNTNSTIVARDASGNFSAGAITGTSISDSSGNVRAIPQNPQTSAYILAIGDVGKHISITTGGVTVNSGIFSAGDAVTIYNNSGSNQTITQGTSVTMYLAGTATTGNRTLAQRGVCTVLCVASNTFVISGAGLS